MTDHKDKQMRIPMTIVMRMSWLKRYGARLSTCCASILLLSHIVSSSWDWSKERLFPISCLLLYSTTLVTDHIFQINGLIFLPLLKIPVFHEQISQNSQVKTVCAKWVKLCAYITNTKGIMHCFIKYKRCREGGVICSPTIKFKMTKKIGCAAK